MNAPLPDTETAPAVEAQPTAPKRKLDKKKLLLTLGGAAARGIANAVAFGLAGLALNVVLLAVCWGALGRLSAAGPVTAESRGALAAVGAWLSVHWKTLLAGALLVPGFPVAWLFAGKKRGLDAAVKHVVKTYKAGLVELIVRKVVERLRRAEWIERYNQSGMRATLNELLPRYLSTLDDLPGPVRPILRLVVRRVDVGGFLLTVFDEKQLAELDPDELADGAAARANEFIDDKVLSVSWLPVWIVLGANLLYVVGLFVAAR